VEGQYKISPSIRDRPAGPKGIKKKDTRFPHTAEQKQFNPSPRRSGKKKQLSPNLPMKQTVNDRTSFTVE
jgi:hypothetical protein